MATGDEKDYQDYLDYQEYQEYQASHGQGPSSNDPATWPKDASGQPVNPQAPGAGPVPTGVLNPRVLATGATRAFTGLVQAGVAPIESLTGLPLVERATKSTAAIEKVITGDHPVLLGKATPADIEATKEAMGITTSFALPIPKIGKGADGAKFFRDTAKMAAAGGAVAAAQYDPTAADSWDKYSQMMWGVGIGIPIGAISTALPAGKNFFLRIFKKPPTPETTKVVEEVLKSKEVAPLMDELSGGQRGGSYELEMQEGRVSGSVAREQTNTAVSKARQVLLDFFKKPTATATEIGERVQASLNSWRTAAQSAASKAYGATVDMAKATARQDTAYNVGIAVPETASTILENVPMGSKWYDDLIDPALKKYGQQVSEAAWAIDSGGGKLGMDDLINLHQGATRLRAGIADLQRGKSVSDSTASAMRLGKKLVDAIERDVGAMDDALATARSQEDFARIFPEGSAPGEKFQEAWGYFKQARDDYKAFRGEMRQMDWALVSQAFGKDAKDAAGQIRVLANAEPGEQAKLVRVLRRHSPETLEQLKRWKINDAGQRMMDQSKAGSLAPIDAKAFINELANGERVQGELLFSDAERQHVKSSIAYIRLLENRASLAAKGVENKRVGMALVSQAPAFLMSNLYDILATGKLEWYFFTKEGRAALQKVATTKPGSEQYLKASAVLSARSQQPADNTPIEGYRK